MPTLKTSSTSTSTTTTTSSTRRVDVGGRQFTGPVADNDRDGPKLGNAALLQDLASGAMSAMNMLRGIPFGFGALEGLTHGVSPLLQPDSPFLGAEDQKWGEVEQTTAETLEKSGMVHKYGDDAVLVIANGPEDMKQLNHEDEANQIADSQGDGKQTVVLWNPSKEAMQTMLKEGGFKDVVFSGHGEEGSVYMTGADGEAVAVSGDELAEMFKDSDVENVFLNVCHGLGGGESVAQDLADIGINTLGWLGSVADSDAREGAGDWASRLSDGSSWLDMWNTSKGFEGMDTLFGNWQARQDRKDARQGQADAKADEGLLGDFQMPQLDLFNWDLGGFWF